MGMSIMVRLEIEFAFMGLEKVAEELLCFPSHQTARRLFFSYGCVIKLASSRGLPAEEFNYRMENLLQHLFIKLAFPEIPVAWRN